MNPCIVIPCRNHAASVAAVARAARVHAPVIIVDDGSEPPVGAVEGCELIRLERPSGKGAALATGFARAAEMGCSHVITMDADGQHFAGDIPKFLAAAAAQPQALVVGVRDFYAAGCPNHRRRSNAVSTFWFRVETGVRMGDTQCGFRCYPVTLTQRLKIRSTRFAYELEFMVRASWVGAPIVPVPVQCVYDEGLMRHSNFRPVRDLAHITTMNIGLVLQSWCVPQSLRVAWSRGETKSISKTVGEFFAEHAGDPVRMSLAVGLGLFFGIAPLWGCQMLVTAACAHFFRLNKAIALLASNISIPPMMPLIFAGALTVGHWLMTGQGLVIHIDTLRFSREAALAYLGQWLLGSFVLAAVVAVTGGVATYGIARIVRPR